MPATRRPGMPTPGPCKDLGGPASLFSVAQAPAALKRRRARDYFSAHREQLQDAADAYRFLDYIFTPADGSWAFLPSGKTGTSSALAFLHHLTTGQPLTARLQESSGMNPDQAAHELHRAQVFCALLSRGDRSGPDNYLQRTLRLGTVRDPLARALSGFCYICRADAAGLSQFYAERARMSVLTGFDWTRHPFTAGGFERFLDYLRSDLAHHAERPVDSHFRPQVLNLRPGLYRPDLLGRCEDLPGFFREVAERLGRRLPEGAVAAAPRNRGGADADRAAWVTAAGRRLAAEVFAADYERFGYSV